MVEVSENILARSNDILWSYILIALLITLGIYFTIRSGFAQFRFFGEMLKLLGAGTTKGREKGSVSTFQTFCISTASRVGTGNLAGVAIAIKHSLKGGKDIPSPFFDCGDITSDTAKYSSPWSCSEASGNFLLHLDHSNISFSEIIINKVQ